MNTIKRKDIDKELEKLRELKNQYGPNFKSKLESIGYTLSSLGAGKTARIEDGCIECTRIKSRNYLNGEYLVVGDSKEIGRATPHGTVWIFVGYCKKIVEDDE